MLKQLLFSLISHPSFWIFLFLISPPPPISLPPLALQSFPAAPSLTSALNNKAVCMCREELKRRQMVLSLPGCSGLIELDLLFFSRRLSWIPWITSHELQSCSTCSRFCCWVSLFLVITSSCGEFREGPVVTLLK